MWALACFVVGYNVMHHNALFGSAEVGTNTRLADWIDLATPFAVLLPLLWFVRLQRPPARWWIAATVGSILYVEGHGIHLSANSIGNTAASSDTPQQTLDVIHLWDEVVGHYVWYLGLAVVIAACAASVRGRSLDVPVVALVVGGAACGLTWATNGLEGGTAVASLVAALAAIVLALVGYAIRHGGFPQPSSL